MWTLSTLLILVGLLGVVVPILPGTTLMLFAMVLHKLLLPSSIAWSALGWIGLVWLISVIIDFGGTLLGTKLFGGSRWGMAGAGGGALIGMFFSLPALLLGTIFGAIIAERYVANKTHRESLRSGMGAAVGFVLATVGKLVCAIVMVIQFLSGTGLWTAGG